ncbi:MAG: chaperone modulator CbpM [Anaerolineales bacterium]|jgi:DNA-binding transcriptional MerR regulator
MANSIVVRTPDEKTLYIRSYAARLAGVSEEFLVECEQEGLITCQSRESGESAFTRNSIRRLSLIRRLHRDLDLDLEAIELVLHMRRRIIDLQSEIERVNREALQKEGRLVAELQQLRAALAPEGHLEDLP